MGLQAISAIMREKRCPQEPEAAALGWYLQQPVSPPREQFLTTEETDHTPLVCAQQTELGSELVAPAHPGLQASSDGSGPGHGSALL